jgi:hypothetical protein
MIVVGIGIGVTVESASCAQKLPPTKALSDESRNPAGISRLSSRPFSGYKCTALF